MSRTTLYAGATGGELREIEEYQNAYGSGMYVWRKMADHYLDYDFTIGTDHFWIEVPA